jgi:hypothetical protein
MTTNQKVAGSSPAERATEIPRFAGKTWSQNKGPEIIPALLTPTRHQPVNPAASPIYRQPGSHPKAPPCLEVLGLDELGDLPEEGGAISIFIIRDLLVSRHIANPQRVSRLRTGSGRIPPRPAARRNRGPGRGARFPGNDDRGRRGCGPLEDVVSVTHHSGGRCVASPTS